MAMVWQLYIDECYHSSSNNFEKSMHATLTITKLFSIGRNLQDDYYEDKKYKIV
jgi:hypothetical protein